MSRVRPRAVFFDAAGTLMHLRRSVGAIYAGAAAPFGVRADPEALDTAFRFAFRSAPPLAFPGAAPETLAARERWWWRRIVRQVFAAHSFPAFDDFFNILYARFAATECWTAYPDALPALARLKAEGFIVGVVSNFDARLILLCRRLGLDRFLDSLTLSSRTGFAKPDPRIFHCALRLHRLAPGEAVHVGDSAAEDIAGATRAGLRAFLVRGEGRHSLAGLAAAVEAVLGDR